MQYPIYIFKIGTTGRKTSQWNHLDYGSTEIDPNKIELPTHLLLWVSQKATKGLMDLVLIIALYLGLPREDIKPSEITTFLVYVGTYFSSNC